jgi:hypothetical protein
MCRFAVTLRWVWRCFRMELAGWFGWYYLHLLFSETWWRCHVFFFKGIFSLCTSPPLPLCQALNVDSPISTHTAKPAPKYRVVGDALRPTNALIWPTLYSWLLMGHILGLKWIPLGSNICLHSCYVSPLRLTAMARSWFISSWVEMTDRHRASKTRSSSVFFSWRAWARAEVVRWFTSAWAEQLHHKKFWEDEWCYWSWVLYENF